MRELLIPLLASLHSELASTFPTSYDGSALGVRVGHSLPLSVENDSEKVQPIRKPVKSVSRCLLSASPVHLPRCGVAQILVAQSKRVQHLHLRL